MQRCLKENTAKQEHEPAQAHIRLLSVRVSGSLLFIYIGLSKLKARTHPPPPPFPPGKRTAVAWQLPHWHPSAQQPPFLPAVHVPQIRMQLPTSIAPEGKMEEKKKKGIFLVRRFVSSHGRNEVFARLACSPGTTNRASTHENGRRRRMPAS